MKRWIHASTDASTSIKPGDRVTVYNGKHGHANYDATFEEYFTNSNGVKMAELSGVSSENSVVPASSIIPSEREWLYSISIDEVLTKDFVASMTHKDDSMWCDKVRTPRVDKDNEIENVTGIEAYMSGVQNDNTLRVVITSYISKHYSEDEEWEDKMVKVTNPLVDEALDILKRAPEVIVNYAGYQRIFKR